MLFSTPAGKLPALRASLNPSSPRPLSSDRHFVVVSPHPLHIGVAVPRKTGKRVNPSPTLTPKSAARSAITEEAWLSWDELKSHCKLAWQHPLNHNSWPFLADSQPLQNRKGNLPAKRHPETHFPKGPTVRQWGWRDSNPSRQRRHPAHRETEQTRDTRLKSSTLWTKESPKNCPNPAWSMPRAPQAAPRKLRPPKLWSPDSHVIPARNC